MRTCTGEIGFQPSLRVVKKVKKRDYPGRNSERVQVGESLLITPTPRVVLSNEVGLLSGRNMQGRGP